MKIRNVQGKQTKASVTNNENKKLKNSLGSGCDVSLIIQLQITESQNLQWIKQLLLWSMSFSRQAIFHANHGYTKPIAHSCICQRVMQSKQIQRQEVCQ